MFVFPYVIFYIKIKWQVISFSIDPLQIPCHQISLRMLFI